MIKTDTPSLVKHGPNYSYTEDRTLSIMGMIADDNGDHAVTIVGGCVLQTKMDGKMITLTDERGQVTTVTQADVKQSNGVVHIIDTVMLPAE